jgi:hypothetical protein
VRTENLIRSVTEEITRWLLYSMNSNKLMSKLNFSKMLTKDISLKGEKLRARKSVLQIKQMEQVQECKYVQT